MTMMTEIDNSTNHNHNISSSTTTRKSCDRLSMKCMNVKIFNQTILPSSSSLNSVQKNKFNKKNDVDDVNDQSAIINMTTTTATTTTTMMTTSVTKMLSLTDANMMDKLKTDDNNNENVTKKANFIDKDDEPILSSSSSLPSTIKMNDQQQQQKTNISSGLMNQIDEKKVLSSPLPFATSASININKNHHSKPETINDLNKDHLDDNDDDNQRFFACEYGTIRKYSIKTIIEWKLSSSSSLNIDPKQQNQQIRSTIVMKCLNRLQWNNDHSKQQQQQRQQPPLINHLNGQKFLAIISDFHLGPHSFDSFSSSFNNNDNDEEDVDDNNAANVDDDNDDDWISSIKNQHYRLPNLRSKRSVYHYLKHLWKDFRHLLLPDNNNDNGNGNDYYYE
uniref:Uncharacterized protein n=1 Tax=Dermatophagoides pteronyssinus TaxID=6956 RepID=A0A6P6Y9K4_DERPT|nr:putative uncharacterized protein DDB_G0282129 [Dermatophagoides pteronyssinus]